MHLFVNHRTDYRFSEPQARLIQLLRLTPASHEGQTIVDWRIDVDCDARLKHSRDGYGNEVTMLYVDGPTEHIAISVTGEVLTVDRAGIVSGTVETLPPLLYTQATALTRASSDVMALARDVEGEGGGPLDRVHRLNHAVHTRLRFDAGRAVADRDAAMVLTEGHGIGMDFAHVFIAAARAMGFPARFVSGYLYSEDAEDPHRHSPHGWAEAYVEDYGWIAFDPAYEICPHEAYIRIAIGLDYREAAPVSGARVGGGQELLEVGVGVGLSQSQTQA
jgi:transglutaminase-like putative cysteine protease